MAGRFCVMLDCSRNAVMKPEKVKEFILKVKTLGYNCVMLYLEDTFEVKGEPLFGYLRGRYTVEELKDIDTFAIANRIELIPCVQTLAHLNAIFRWSEYAKINDTADILLVGEERTYQLVERILDTVKLCFTSNVINIGLDEAHLLGRGKYADINGAEDRFDIFCNHLDRVNALVEERGLKAIMWSDTFFNRAENAVPYADLTVPERALKRLPKNVDLVCWDYYHTEKEYYEKVLGAHDQFENPIWYACSAYTSRGFAPCNAYSLKAIIPAMQSCRELGIENVIVTTWGGNGAECSAFAVLPSLYYAVQVFNGNDNIDEIAKSFKQITGEDFFSMMYLDSPNNVGVNDQNYGPSKYMLYNDLFFGIYDCTILENDAKKYSEYAEKLLSLGKNSSYSYVFKTLSKLCSVLEVKYSLGIETRRAYKDRDILKLNQLTNKYQLVLDRVEDFYCSFKKQWFIENKPNGFDVQDIRIGGLIARIRSCKERLKEYLEGKITKIEELEETILDINTGEKVHSKEIVVLNDWKSNVTVNIL